MCGRYIITSAPEALRQLFGYGEQPNFPPRHNVAPTQPVPVVILESGIRRFKLMRWGFLPSWVKDPRKFALVINARSETVLEKPSFRNAIRRRRCLLPADGYYEWQASPLRKRPFCIRRRDGQPIAFAGVAETWTGPNGEEVDTVAIVTAAAAPEMALLHDRVPVTIEPRDFDLWLDGDAVSAELAMGMMVAPPPGTFVWHEVSTAVNRVANDSPDLILPFSAEEADAEAMLEKKARAESRTAAKPAPRSKPLPAKPDDGQGSLF
jgi:putative SOS response-associated peptidase YedK